MYESSQPDAQLKSVSDDMGEDLAVESAPIGGCMNTGARLANVVEAAKKP
jgi:hypothetical protein